MHKYKIALLFSCCMFVGWGATRAEELRLTYDVRIEQVVDKGSGKKEEKEFRHRVLIGLGNGYVYFTDPDGAKVFELTKGRIIYVDDPGKSISDVSLFTDVGFRFLELRNRLYIREVVLKAAEKSKGPPPAVESVFDLETFFGIESPGSKASAITETSSDGKVVYGSDQGTWVDCRLSDQAMNPEQRALWDKYLLYGCRIHPQIRRKIASLERVPEFLRYSYRNGGRSATVELTLVKAALESGDSYKLPSGYQKLYGPPGEDLNSIIAGVREGKSSVKQLSGDDYAKLVKGSAAQGNYFDAALTALEYGLQVGKELTPDMKAAVDTGRTKDERTRVFFDMLGPKDKAAAEKAGKALEKIKRKGLTRGHVIDLMIGDDKAIAGDFKGAKELFLKVLKTNPYLAGAYKDLGDLLNRDYYVVSAWQCWDTARFLYPDHKMLKPIDDYEAWLRKTFPDFFLFRESAPAAPVAGT